MIDDLDDINILSKIGHYGKIAGRGFIAFSIALGVDDVYDTYKNGGDVWGEVGKEVGEIGAAIAVGAFLIFVFSPVGWVAVVATAIVEGVIITAASLGTGQLGEKIGDKTHKLYDWAETHIKDWL